MKLFRYGPEGKEKPGVMLADGRRIDVSSVTPDFDEAFFESDGLVRLQDFVDDGAVDAPSVGDGVRLGSCVARPSKLICIGLNYLDHIRETGAKTPEEPVLFFKATTALCGPNDDAWIPRDAERLDWEVELAVVIGKRARYIDADQAHDHVAGYSLHNDYSERDHQMERSGQWVKGKSGDRFAPLGPYLATGEDALNIHDRQMWLKVNGVTKQDSTTANMLFQVPQLIAYISQFMTLLPGDVISTGTPPGVGFASDPPQFLKPGDVVELGIEGLGEARQEVKNAP